MDIKRIGPTYSDGTARFLLRQGAKVVSAAIDPNGTISGADDWSTLVDWELAGLLGSQSYGPATYGHVRLFVEEPLPQPYLP